MVTNDSIFLEMIFDPFSYIAKNDATWDQKHTHRTLANIIDPDVTQPPMQDLV